MAKSVKLQAKKPFDPSAYLRLPYSRVIVPEEDGTFRAEILEFPGCIATGNTEAEALASLRDVAISWLEAVAAMGKPIPQPVENIEFSGKLVIRMPKSLHKKAVLAAERDGVSLNHFIVTGIAEQVGLGASAKSRGTSGPNIVLMSLPSSHDIGHQPYGYRRSSSLSSVSYMTAIPQFLPVREEVETS